MSTAVPRISQSHSKPPIWRTFSNRIGLLDERQRKLFTGGRVSAEGRLRGRGLQHPLSAQATIHAREFRFQPLQGHFLTYSLLTEGTADLNAARTGIEINRIGLTFRVSREGSWNSNPCRELADPGIQTKRRHHRRDQRLGYRATLWTYSDCSGREHGPLPVPCQCRHSSGFRRWEFYQFAVRKYWTDSRRTQR